MIDISQTGAVVGSARGVWKPRVTFAARDEGFICEGNAGIWYNPINKLKGFRKAVVIDLIDNRDGIFAVEWNASNLTVVASCFFLVVLWKAFHMTNKVCSEHGFRASCSFSIVIHGFGNTVGEGLDVIIE